MRTEFLCISVLRVASGPRVKLAYRKSALTPSPSAVLRRWSLTVALWFPHCFLFFFSVSVVMLVVTVFNSCPLCFLLY